MTGAGVYYGAAMTEAISCRDEDVYIVGGANSAGQAAMYFARYAAQGDDAGARRGARGDDVPLPDRADRGDDEHRGARPTPASSRPTARRNLEALTIADGATGETERVPATSLFIFIGAAPHTDWLAGAGGARRARLHPGRARPAARRATRRRAGRWTATPFLLETSVPGVFAAGDVRHGVGQAGRVGGGRGRRSRSRSSTSI